MTTAAGRARQRTSKGPKKTRGPSHIHLPSVHVRAERGVGFDYEEDYYVRGERVMRVVRLVALQAGEPTLIRETRDLLCAEELAQLRADLPILMDKENPAAKPIMEECARKEFARQVRIARGEERACASCGCSESRSCSGGCVWATVALCSRCV